MSVPGGQVRIIGGKWRSRKLRFPAASGVRPSPDAVRETLFNWLQLDIEYSRCLDLYAGSGAIGFEAASRGASSVVMVEANTSVSRALRQNTLLLDAEQQIIVETEKAEKFLGRCQSAFDIVFMDPPFDADHLEAACAALANSKAIDNSTLLYVESAKRREPLPISPSWHIIRQKTRGLVQSTLIKTIIP